MEPKPPRGVGRLEREGERRVAGTRAQHDVPDTAPGEFVDDSSGLGSGRIHDVQRSCVSDAVRMEAVRTVIEPGDSGPGRFYRLLTATIVPRPIAWVSTLSADGVANLAPYSFFTVASTKPPVVQFTSVGRKDSLRNIEETGEFVVNIATVGLMEKVNASSAAFDHEVDEFAEVGLGTEPSARVRPPRVAQSPAAIECALRQVVEVGDSFVVMGDVLAVALAPEVLAEDGAPAFDVLGPVSRLGRTEWGLTPDVRVLERPSP